MTAVPEIPPALGRCRETRQGALSALAMQIDTRGDGQALLIFNSLSFERNSIIQLPMPESPLLMKPNSRSPAIGGWTFQNRIAV